MEITIPRAPQRLPYVPSEDELRRYDFTWLKQQGIDDALIQTYSGHASRASLEVYSRLSIGAAQEEYNRMIDKFPG